MVFSPPGSLARRCRRRPGSQSSARRRSGERPASSPPGSASAADPAVSRASRPRPSTTCWRPTRPRRTPPDPETLRGPGVRGVRSGAIQHAFSPDRVPPASPGGDPECLTSPQRWARSSRSCGRTPSRRRRRAGRAGRLDDAAAAAALAAVAVGGGDLPDGRHAGRRDGHHAEVRRLPAADRGRRRHPGHRPGAAAARGARHREVLGVGAPGRGRSPGTRRCWSRARPARRRRRSATAGTTPGCSPRARRPSALVPSPVMTAMRDGRDRPDRGADPDPRRRAGRADHHPVGEDAADPRARRRGAGAQGVQRDRHGQRPGQGRQRAVLGAAPPVQHRGAAAAGQTTRTRSRSSSPGSPTWPRPSSCRRCRPRWRRSAGW